MLIPSFVVVAFLLAQGAWTAPGVNGDTYSSGGIISAAPAGTVVSSVGNSIPPQSKDGYSSGLPITSSSSGTVVSPSQRGPPPGSLVQPPSKETYSATSNVSPPPSGTIVSPSQHGPPVLVPPPSKDTYSSGSKIPPPPSGTVVSPSQPTAPIAPPVVPPPSKDTYSSGSKPSPPTIVSPSHRNAPPTTSDQSPPMTPATDLNGKVNNPVSPPSPTTWPNSPGRSQLPPSNGLPPSNAGFPGPGGGNQFNVPPSCEAGCSPFAQGLNFPGRISPICGGRCWPYGGFGPSGFGLGFARGFSASNSESFSESSQSSGSGFSVPRFGGLPPFLN